MEAYLGVHLCVVLASSQDSDELELASFLLDVFDGRGQLSPVGRVDLDGGEGDSLSFDSRFGEDGSRSGHFWLLERMGVCSKMGSGRDEGEKRAKSGAALRW